GMRSHLSGAVNYAVSGQAPTAVLSVAPATGIAPLDVSASTAASTAASGTIASSSIDFGDGSPATAGPNAAHTYIAPRTYTVTATVKDQHGMSANTTQTVTVVNQPPLAALSVTPSSGIAPVSVTATTATSSDPDGSIASSIIDFGDGTAVSGPSATHTYSTPGTYTVTATVYDNLNASAKATQIVTVAQNVPPVVTLAVTPSAGTAPLTVTA